MASPSEFSTEPIQDEIVGPSSRLRKPTEKGLAYQIELKSQNCKAVQRQIEKCTEKIDLLLSQYGNVYTVENEFKTVKQMCLVDLKISFNAWINLLENEDDKTSASAWYGEVITRNTAFEVKVSSWIDQAKRSIEDQRDQRSNISRGSRKSSVASKHSKSSNSSVRSALAKERARTAELKAKTLMLEKRQTLKNEMEKVLLEEELAVAQARELAYAEVAEQEILDEIGNVKTELYHIDRADKAVHMAEAERILDNIESREFVEAKSEVRRPELTSTVAHKKRETSANSGASHEVDQNLPPMFGMSKPQENFGMFEIRNRDLLLKQNDLMSALTKQHQQSLLPDLTLTKFSGDPIEYVTFMKAFESQIETRLDTPSTRLRYLEQYLDGDARELIKGCLYMDSVTGYFTAKRLLDEKYGDPYVISNAYLKKVAEWPNIKSGDDSAIDHLATFLGQCLNAMTSLSHLSVLEHPHNLQMLIVKLPFYLQDRWRREAVKIRSSNMRIPGFKEFVNFVKTEAKIANDPVFSRGVLGKIQVPERSAKNKGYGRVSPLQKQNNRATKVEESQNVQNQADRCPFCKEVHDLDLCQSFVKRTLEDRKAWLKEKSRCYACYKTGHRANGCLQRKSCKTCNGKHPTSLHDPQFALKIKMKKEQDEERLKSDNNTEILNASTIHNASPSEELSQSLGTMPIVPVKLIANNRELITYAMLDSCSTGTFILEDVRRDLQIEGTETTVLVNTMNGSKIHHTNVVTGLVVSDLKGNNKLNLPRTFSRSVIPGSKAEIPTDELVAKWKHLSKISEELPAYIPEAKIGILIGANCPKAIEPKDFIVSQDGGPFAMKTFAGWTVIGGQSGQSDVANLCCHGVLVEEIVPGKPFQLHFVLESKVKEVVTPQAFNKMFEVEFNERSCGQEYGHSIQDKAFLEKMVEECKFKNGHYELPLPFLEKDQVYMPNNRDMANQRMESLKKKLLRNPTFHRDYVKFMNQIPNKVHNERSHIKGLCEKGTRDNESRRGQSVVFTPSRRLPPKKA